MGAQTIEPRDRRRVESSVRRPALDIQDNRLPARIMNGGRGAASITTWDQDIRVERFTRDLARAEDMRIG